MATPQVQSDPIYSLPFLYATGMVISNDATTPNTVLDIAAGQVRDSNDNIDMPLGANNPPLNGAATTTPLLLNAAVNGVNGLDTGALAASTMYTVYCIGDSSYKNPVAVILTLSTNTQPLMPFGYDSYRVIGYWPTDSSSHFLLGYVSNLTTGGRVFTYDAPQATAVTAGASTTYAEVDLVKFVPSVNNIPVLIQYNYAANAAGDTLKMQGFNSTGDAITVIGQVVGGTAHLEGVAQVIAQIEGSAAAHPGHPAINYKVSSASDSVALSVAGFIYGI